ncbi:LysM peptidoglycan-binding domain-containing protein [Sagittula salina]|uniref:LysM peptidoglycan-binding domain-containing protein n=1 Tax=Sagittula salina TaxID=2820268 RepID=A0A940S1K3_9RHOB|nr:LysM peptidoglycan-binding domain-containing protein [Sagittula salina]MBP0483152.1 LysM peptidoglycan-binding domain-containing protein [Sagittula salina]
MIRMVLFALGFVAITVTLLIVQPGSRSRMPHAAPVPAVSRAQPALTEAVTRASVPAEDIARIAPDEPRFGRRVPSTTPAPAAPPPVQTLGDEDMRRMTWEALSGLNRATGRETTPGQPGSLLHTIVQRSLAIVSAPDGQSAAYVVQDGDSLVSIAERIYGDVNMTGPLFAANQSILTRPDDLRPGQMLVLPGK